MRSRPDGPNPDPPELPRALVFGASLWIAVSWLVAIGVRPPLQPTSTSYTPAARMMLVSMSLGVLVAWPLARLSTRSPARPIATAALETVSLVALSQIVIWPLRLVTNWTVPRLGLLASDLLCITILVGGLLAVLGWDRRGRSLAMLGLVAWVVTPPLLGLGLADPAALAEASPIVRAWTTAGGGPAAVPAGAWLQTGIVAIVGLCIWIVAFASAPRGGLATGAAPR